MTDYEHNTPSLNQAAGAAEKGGLFLPPPTNICNSVSYKYSQPTVAPSALLRTDRTRVGRVFLSMFLAATLPTLAACGKDGQSSTSDSTAHYRETHWNWDKTTPGGLRIDTTWAGDTIIYF